MVPVLQAILARHPQYQAEILDPLLTGQATAGPSRSPQSVPFTREAFAQPQEKAQASNGKPDSTVTVFAKAALHVRHMQPPEGFNEASLSVDSERFERLEIVGRGSFGDVYRG